MNSSHAWTAAILLSGVLLACGFALQLFSSINAVPSSSSQRGVTVAQLKQRLEFIAFDDERRKLQQQLLQALQREIVDTPFSPYLHAEYFDLQQAINDPMLTQSSADFSLRPMLYLAHGSQKMRWYLARLCVIQTSQVVEFGAAVCDQIQYLVPRDQSDERAAQLLQVTLGDYRATMLKSFKAE